MHLPYFAEQSLKSIKDKISVSTGFLFLCAVSALVIPVQWVFAWCLALTVHELCHYIALRACGCEVCSIQIGYRGVLMETTPLTLGKEAICAYAGPLGGLTILLFAPYIPRTAICAFLFSAYNLLPIYPLDGGRGIGCILKKFLPGSVAERVSKFIENTVLFTITTTMVLAVFKWGLGVLPAIAVCFLFWRGNGAKFPCKKCRLGLQ